MDCREFFIWECINSVDPLDSTQRIERQLALNSSVYAAYKTHKQMDPNKFMVRYEKEPKREQTPAEQILRLKAYAKRRNKGLNNKQKTK